MPSLQCHAHTADGSGDLFLGLMCDMSHPGRHGAKVVLDPDTRSFTSIRQSTAASPTPSHQANPHLSPVLGERQEILLKSPQIAATP